MVNRVLWFVPSLARCTQWSKIHVWAFRNLNGSLAAPGLTTASLGGPLLSVIRITLGSRTQQLLEFCAFPRELANWDEASRLPVWRLGCYASSPNGANVWTTSYMPGSNVAMASASWRNGRGAGSWRMA